MEAWINALLNLAPSSVQTFAAGVRDRLKAFYSWVNKVFTGTFTGWGKFAAALAQARNWIVWPIGEGFLTMKWFFTVRAPALIKSAIDTLRTWATNAINAAESRVKALVATLDRWAQNAVNLVKSKLAEFQAWATGKINSTIATLTATRNIVMNLLTVPSRLASWLVAAMVRELWAYADRNQDRIANWVRQKSVSYTVDAVSKIEKLLGRLL